MSEDQELTDEEVVAIYKRVMECDHCWCIPEPFSERFSGLRCCRCRSVELVRTQPEPRA